MRGKKRGLLVLDVGNLLFGSFHFPPARKEEFRKKADLILESLNQMGCNAFTPGEFDFALEKGYLLEMTRKVNFPFLLANLIDEKSNSPLFESYLIKEVGGVKIAIFGIMTDQLSKEFFVRNPGLAVRDPFKIAKNLVTKLKGKSDLIIALSHQGLSGDRKLAEEVAGIDIIVGSRSRSKIREPIVVNNTLILQTGARGQFLGRLDLKLVNPKGPYRLVSLSRKISLEKQLKYTQRKIDHYYQISQGNDPLEFFKDDKKSLDSLNSLLKKMREIKKELDDLRGGDFYINTLVSLGKNVGKDSEVEGLIERYKREIIKIQKSEVLSRGPSQKKSARSGQKLEMAGIYLVGEQSCRKCHQKEYRLWEKTRHSRAYQSLVKNRRHYEAECIGCHSTGYEQEGEFRLSSQIEKFKNVQCEACHGPGSLHKEKDGKIIKKVPRSTCVKCHTKKRDADFNYEDAVTEIMMGKSH